jgi:hypothetical protein
MVAVNKTYKPKQDAWAKNTRGFHDGLVTADKLVAFLSIDRQSRGRKRRRPLASRR